MNTVKTAIIVIALLIVLSLISYFIPYKELISSIPYFNTVYNNTSLTINSKNGKSVVTVDGTGYGETPVTISNLLAGDHLVSIERVSDSKDFYKKNEIQISLQRGTEAIIDYEIAPGGISSGYILYYTKSFQSSENKGFITVTSKQEDIKIYLDNELLGEAPISTQSLNANNFQLKASRDGYEDLSFPIIIRNGYNLNIELSLLPIPTKLSK